MYCALVILPKLLKAKCVRVAAYTKHNTEMSQLLPVTVQML